MSGAGCVSTLQAHAAVAPDIPLMITGNCVEGGLLKTVGAAAEGVYSQEEFLADTDESNADVKVFLAALKAYAPAGTRNTAFSAAGFSSVMNVYNGLKQLSPDGLTSSAILASFKSARNVPNFMGNPYSCDGHILAAPAVCNASNRIIQVKGGNLVDLSQQWVDAWQRMG